MEGAGLTEVLYLLGTSRTGPVRAVPPTCLSHEEEGKGSSTTRLVSEYVGGCLGTCPWGNLLSYPLIHPIKCHMGQQTAVTERLRSDPETWT